MGGSLYYVLVDEPVVQRAHTLVFIAAAFSLSPKSAVCTSCHPSRIQICTSVVLLRYFMVPLFLIDDKTENSHAAGLRSLRRFRFGEPIALREDAETANQMLRLRWIPAMGELGEILAV